MVLFHGTNRQIKNLKLESFLTDNILDAKLFSEIKNGFRVYKFEVNEKQVYRDENTSIANWYITKEVIQPIKCHYFF